MCQRSTGTSCFRLPLKICRTRRKQCNYQNLPDRPEACLGILSGGVFCPVRAKTRHQGYQSHSCSQTWGGGNPQCHPASFESLIVFPLELCSLFSDLSSKAALRESMASMIWTLVSRLLCSEVFFYDAKHHTALHNFNISDVIFCANMNPNKLDSQFHLAKHVIIRTQRRDSFTLVNVATGITLIRNATHLKRIHKRRTHRH